MKRAKHWLLTTATVLILGLLASTDAALPFKKVSIAKTPASTSTSTTTTTTSTANPDYDTDKEEKEESEPPQVAANEAEENKSDNATLSKKKKKSDNVTLTRNSKLTGIPQIDYIWDPNLPRELRGFNLSTYPFLSTVPPMDEIHFKCEGLHDGFYASIEYKCQIYHHCVYGIRHDFLCANFTAFDQRTFICHFASDVDCEGSQKYWNRNDELYMATTTSSTSTTTTTTEAPPPSQPRRRAQRPNHRPYGRRPVDDYYDEDEYEDDYYDNRGHRRKVRPRLRKPLPLEYDDEYEDDKRIEVKPTRRNRNHYRDEDDLSDEYFEDRRNRPGARRGKPSTTSSVRGKKASARKPGRVDERRSFNEDRDLEEPRRTSNGRRRNNEKRTTPSTADVLDELDEYEKPYGLDLDQEEAAEEQKPQKVKTTPKPLSEFITPKAAPASVYARPRAPPRIARPVPITEKKKYSYPVQKNTATTPATTADEDYYPDPAEEQEQANEDDYEQPATRNALRRRTAGNREPTPKPSRTTLRKPVTDHDQDYHAPETRRKRPPGAARTRAPPAAVAEPDFDDVDVDYEEKTTPASRQRVRPAARKPVQRPRQPVERVPSEEEEEQLEPLEEQQPATRSRDKTLRRQQQKVPPSSRPRALPTSRTTAAPASEQDEPLDDNHNVDGDEPEVVDEVSAKPQRTAAVRVVKRPFLPSRGGSPYLPRGLQPVGVGVAIRQQVVTESTPIDMGSTISGVRLLEHGAPLLRGGMDRERERERESDRNRESDPNREDVPSPSTLPPRSALPTAVTPPQPAKLNLDELYENDYDVTLNDALDPTLKPLTPQQHPHPLPHQLQSRHYASAYAAPASVSAPAESVAYNPFSGHYQQASIYQNQNQNHQSPSSSIASALQSQSQSLSPSQSQSHHSSDSYFSSTDIRRRAVVPPPQISRSHRHEYAAGGAGAVRSSQIQIQAARPNQQFYDDFSY